MPHARPLVVFGAIFALAACQRSAPTAETAVNAARRADCREEVNRQYNAQNRVDLTRRDERDFAFAGTYNTGISSRGLGAEFQRDQMIDSCLRANGGSGQAEPGFGPATSPTTSGGRGSSL